MGLKEKDITDTKKMIHNTDLFVCLSSFFEKRFL
jgi:hypothetical protein